MIVQKTRETLMHKMALVTALLIGLTMTTTVFAQGYEEVHGGQDGVPFQSVCTGGYLIGFSGYSSAWVNRIRPICANWDDARASFGPALPSTIFYGRSGGKRAYRKVCPDGRAVIELNLFIYNEPPMIAGFHAYCSTIVGRGASFMHDVAGTGMSGPYKLSMCPRNMFAIGIKGRAGENLNSLGLVCGLSPQAEERRRRAITTRQGPVVGPATKPPPASGPTPPAKRVCMEWQNVGGHRLCKAWITNP